MTVQELRNQDVLCFGGQARWYHSRGHSDMLFIRQYTAYGRVLYVDSAVKRKRNISEHDRCGRSFLRARTIRAMYQC